MSFAKKIEQYSGVNRSLARVSQIVGSTALAPKPGSSLSKMLADAKSKAPTDVKDGVGTVAGAAAGAVVGHHFGRSEDRPFGHWLLGTISGASVGRNVPALLKPAERGAAIHNLLVTHAGVLGSLVFAQHPAVGFVIGSVAGEIGAHVGGLK